MQIMDCVASLLDNFQESFQLWKVIEKLSSVVEAFETIQSDIKLLRSMSPTYKVYFKC